MIGKVEKSITSIVRWILLIVFSFLFLIPLVMMIVVSLKSSSDSLSGFSSIILTSFDFSGYKEVFEIIPYWTYMKNTLLIAGLSMLGQVIVCPMVAYSISKIKWKGAGIITIALFATMMVPYFTIMVPLYKIWSMLGLTGTKWPLILCNLFGNSFYIIIIRQFMLGIPDSVLEAATIDGCGELRKFISIVLPMSKPAIATIAILSFVANWSDYLSPMLYLVNEKDYTLSLGLYAFIGEHSIDWAQMMAAASMFVIPSIIVFVVFQKYYVKGISTTGIK